MDSVAEEWRKIRACENYEVSSIGRVRNSRTGRVLTPWKCSAGYYSISLGSSKKGMVHRFVAAEFIGDCPAGKEVNHINGDKLCNVSTNLEYVTRAQNIQHAIDTGLFSPRKPPVKYGSAANGAKLSAAQVMQIKKLYAEGSITQRKLGAMFGVGQMQISRIVRGQRWQVALQDTDR